MQDLPLTIKEYIVTKEVVDDAYGEHKIQLPKFDRDNMPIFQTVNGYCLLKDEYDSKHSVIVRYLGGDKWEGLSKRSKLKLERISPKDAKQAVFFDSLLQPDILISAAIGPAGTGKTTIALAYALSQYMAEKKPIFLCKPTTMVGEGKAFGPVPGDINEKYAPYLASYEIVLKKIWKEPAGQQFFNTMKEKGHLQFFPIELARGCTFENCTLILDEAQNMSWHETNTMISRMGENSKIIILGDLSQIDTGMHYKKTGLYAMLSAPPFQDSQISSAIELTTQYRSPVTQLITEVNKWLMDRE